MKVVPEDVFTAPFSGIELVRGPQSTAISESKNITHLAITNRPLTNDCK